MKQSHPTGIHCNIHNADTTIGACETDLPEFFTAGCYFCAFEEMKKMREEYQKVKEQRDCLVKAMSIVNIEKKLS